MQNCPISFFDPTAILKEATVVQAGEIQVLSDAVNSPVVRMPGRRFPGVVIQGDSLHYMSVLAKEIQQISMRLNCEELVDLTADLNKLLADKLAGYEKTLRSHDLELPY